jgi:hypothetical protein
MHILRAEMYILGGEMHILRAKMYILGGEMHIPGAKMYILGAEMHILRAKMYIPSAEMYVIQAEITVSVPARGSYGYDRGRLKAGLRTNGERPVFSDKRIPDKSCDSNEVHLDRPQKRRLWLARPGK